MMENWILFPLVLRINHDNLKNFRLFSDFLGFAGALGIQVIVSSIQNDLNKCDILSCQSSNHTISENCAISSNTSETFQASDTLTIGQFVHHQTVAAVMILLASLSQGGFSQVTT